MGEKPETIVRAAMARAAAEMDDAGDARRARQVRELDSKLTEGRLTVAFCGHFSAGKSTLINRLCGAKLLPSSPIPTSANVVAIRGGSEAAATIYKTGPDGERELRVPIDELERYCVDGEGIASVAITYPAGRLGDHTTLLDTPGIDSTDDAHRMATESALHLADVVFYLMDYNHVQSEINFAFAKQLKDWGKPLYFIVNQIDKHRERELSFEAYRKSVDEAFQAWHLEPAGIVYLSMREPDHPHQEFGKLEKLLGELAEIRGPLALYSVDASLRHLVKEHLKWRDEREEPERERLLAEAGGREEADRVRGEMERIAAETERLRLEPQRMQAELLRELQSILDNANVTPAATRDKAHAFLESRKPGFRAGLLFAGAKTAAEQERRAQSFCDDFASQVSAAVDWHVKDLLRHAADRCGYDAGKLEEALDGAFGWKPTVQWLIDRVNPGAVFGNEYTMTYSRDLAAEAKSIYRKEALAVIDTLAAHAAASGDAAAAELRRELAALGAQAGALARLAELAERAAAYAARLAAALPPQAARPALPAPARAGTAQPPGGPRGADAGAAADRARAEAAPAAGLARPAGAGAARSALAGGSALAQQRAAAERLARAAALLEPYAPLAQAAQAMREKAARLADSRFTIALFGAFSAGKSSLANALIGEPVLPVSPNPTTAAINRLVPPTADHPHGTARVVMKPREAMLDDLRYSLALLGEDASPAALPDAAALMQAIGRLSPDAIHAGGRPHYSFLRAAKAGWEAHERLLGTELSVSREEYERFVAVESRSCFVSEIELHYACPLTEQGIVLVDTPGADSVNARHTGVAFNYIKNADAVLFVTYYNHAFSQADRQFLTQLGRVKDQFELDKMFFLVNAADLAADEEELAGVLEHVERNLLQHGIRNPRLFPVSSLRALDAKMADDEELLEASGLARFERSFLDFVRNDLGRLAVESADLDIRRAAGTVAGWLQSAEGDAATRQAERQLLEERIRMAAEAADSFRRADHPPQLAQELSELLFYVAQRVRFRFGDYYNYAFNPSTLQDDGRDLRKMLWTAWLELQRYIRTELSQELQATSLRMEKALNELLGKRYAGLSGEMERLVEGYEAVPYARFELPMPEEGDGWEPGTVDPKWLWSRFKSPRQFFEGEGKAHLRSELEAVIAPSLQAWMTEREGAWTAFYAGQWRSFAERAAERLEADLNGYAQGKAASLLDGADTARLGSLHAQMIDLVSSTIS